MLNETDIKRPRISVIIPCYNAGAWIKETLESVVSQEIENIETIVVDDGSTDNSAQVITQYFPQVTILQTTNQGPGHARNTGTRACKGELVQYLDADDLLAPGKLAIQAQALRETGADIAYGKWQKLVRGAGGNFEPGQVSGSPLTDAEINFFNGSAWAPPAAYLFRKSFVERIGGWNEKFAIIQDARFLLDCALNNAQFIFCDVIMAYYRVHAANSVSTRDPAGFARECMVNATQTQAWWSAHGGITQNRREALLRIYETIARMSFKKDTALFQEAYDALTRLDPHYLPLGRVPLRCVSILTGYKNAEACAYWYRNMKDKFRRLCGLNRGE